MAEASHQISSNAISGNYVSAITSDSAWYFNVRKHRRVKINFEQDGNDITGINALYDLRISGIRKGDVVTFSTAPGKIMGVIKGQWKVSGDGSKLVGKWTYSGHSGQWNLEKIK